MRALITGAAGFIGSNLTTRCLEEGWSVVGVDDLSAGHEEFLPQSFTKDRSRFMVTDFASPEVQVRLLQQEFDVVFHLAAQPSVSYSVFNPAETQETNVNKTLRLMDASRKNVRRFVFASSSSVYGNVDNLPTKEEDNKQPRSPYALQKMIVEDYLRLYNFLYDLESVSLRFFNVFGPRQLGGTPYSTAVAAWLAAIKSEKSMRSDGDGSQSRDMCYVDNVVDACLRAALHQDKLRAESFNVACGEAVSNKDILEHLKKVYPYAQHHDAPWRPGDVMHTLASTEKIEKILGYKPAVNFWEGLERTISWYENNWGTIRELLGRTR